MPIVSTDLVQWCAASMPVDDAGTSGGAISSTIHPRLTQFSSNAVAAVISDGADTRQVTVTGRLASGAIDTEALILNGAVEVVGAKTWERVLRVVAASTSASRIVSFKQGSGGTLRATIGLNEQEARVLFYDSVSAASPTDRYEKLFWKNQHGTLSLLNANVTLTADPLARMFMGITTAVDDTTSVANRLTVPSGPTFVDDSVAQNVPGTNLAAGSRIGVWIKQTLPGSDPANKSTFTTQLAGSTV